MISNTPIEIIDSAGRRVVPDPGLNGPTPIDPDEPILPPKPPTPGGGPIDTLLRLLKTLIGLFRP